MTKRNVAVYDFVSVLISGCVGGFLKRSNCLTDQRPNAFYYAD